MNNNYDPNNDQSNYQYQPSNSNDNQNFNRNTGQDQDENKPEEKKDYFIYIVIAGVVLIAILAIVFVFSVKQKNEQAAREASKASSSTVQIKKLPNSDDSDNSKSEVSADEAKSNVKQAINFGFRIMAQVKSASGESMDLSQLSDSDATTLSKLFTTSQVLQSFNDVTNVSSDGDDTVYGDAGTGTKKIKHPKLGNRYSVKSTDFSINSNNADSFVFEVKLKYQPKGYKAENISLIVTVSKQTGKLTAVEEKV